MTPSSRDRLSVDLRGLKAGVGRSEYSNAQRASTGRLAARSGNTRGSPYIGQDTWMDLRVGDTPATLLDACDSCGMCAGAAASAV